MTSELEMWLAGVLFPRDAKGQLRPVGPSDIDLRAAVSGRKSGLVSRLRGGASRATSRGLCDACGLPMALECNCRFCYRGSDDSFRPPDRRWAHHGSASNRGGTCWLCECALQKLVAAGEWPPKREESVRPKAVAMTFTYPKAPWD